VGKSKPPPPKRKTMEVQLAWLEPEVSPKASRPPEGAVTKNDKPQATPPSSRRGPPKLPGVPDIPPMPVASSMAPKRRHTIEVEMQWVELVDEIDAAKDKPAPKASPAEAKPPARRRPPIPREDE
jgi:hypothetical protein